MKRNHLGLLAVTTAAAILVVGQLAAQPKMAQGRMRPMPPVADAGDARADKTSGLHIPQGKSINFDYNLTDGAGYLWNIQSYGSVGSGNNNAYSGGMYLHINGSNTQPRGQGWANEAGDEIETGPMPARNVSGLQIYRRVKVYKDAGLARWLDIFQNTSGQAVTFTARIYTSFNWSVGRVLTNSGAATVGEKDWAFITESTAGPGNNVPNTLHVFGDKRSKLRPKVVVQPNNNTICLDYSLTVPGNSVVLLCHFESQNTSTETLTKDMQGLKMSRLLKDLPSRVRAMIANLPGTWGLSDVELDRSESADSVILTDDDPIYGAIQNESYTVQTLLGALTLPAEKVIGMAAAPGEEEAVRFVLADGQVVCGRTPEAKIAIALPTGGKLEIPMAKIKSWSYRISKKRPDEPAPTGPAVILRTGDQLAFDPAATRLSFRTRYGVVPIQGNELLEIVLDNPSNGVHRAVFLNGSRLAGMLEPEKITLSLKLGQKLDVPRSLISRIRFATEEKPDDDLCQATLSNEDELMGNLVDPLITVATQYGTVDLKPDTIKAFQFTPSQPGRAAVLLWDGSVLRGQLKQEELTFAILPGPTLKIPLSQVVSLSRSKVSIPDDVRKKVEQLVARLGAESYKDRTAAMEELAKMGAAIIPLLQKYVDDADPEVRQRIGEILDKLGATGATPPSRAMPVFLMDG